jgi:DNA-binding CsgD family transcriptional regulator
MIPESVVQHAVSDLKLTAVQTSILRMVCEGESNWQIAQLTHKSSSSVERAVKALCEQFRIPPLPLKALNRRCALVSKVWAKGTEEGLY